MEEVVVDSGSVSAAFCSVSHSLRWGKSGKALRPPVTRATCALIAHPMLAVDFEICH